MKSAVQKILFSGILATALASVLYVSPLAHARELTGGTSGRSVVDTYQYVPDSVYQVRTALGITTQIELDPAEKILDYSTGFSSGWELSRRDNVFYLKPRNTDVDTNMVVRTEANSYIFELKVVASDWRELSQARAAGVQYKIRFDYPPDSRFNALAVAAEDERSEVNEPGFEQLSTAIQKNRRYHHDYDYATRSKQSWVVPTSVYDDGRFTYVRMNDGVSFPSGNFPAVYGRERARSEEFIVNTTVEGNTIVVHGTYPYLVIRHGTNVVGLRRNLEK